jgi:chromosome segregation ATPase
MADELTPDDVAKWAAALWQGLCEAKREIKRLRAEADKDRVFLEAAEAKVRELRAERDAARAELNRLQDQLGRIANKLVDRNRAIDAAHAGLDAARALATRLAGQVQKLGGVLMTAKKHNTPEWMEYRDSLIPPAEAALAEARAAGVMPPA